MGQIPGWVIQLFIFIVVVIVLVWAAHQLGIAF